MSNIRVIDYKKEHQPTFEKLNRDWISEHYELEPLDLYVLQNPEEAILNKGGAILIALYENEVAGVVALKKVSGTTFEYTKMAVDPAFRRRGIGEAISYASFKKAKELGATDIILYSNTLQAAAIRLYEKLGFRHLEVEKGVYERANVKMILENIDEKIAINCR
jgi:ribosomal protein S18 acetylase RimI-like enzyme